MRAHDPTRGGLPIERVVVHRDGALVERRGALPVTDGRVEVRRLPLLLDESSLRARVDGAILHDLRLGWDLEGVDRAEIPDVAEQLVLRRGELAALEAEQSVLQDQRAQVADLSPSEDTERDEPPTPERVAAWARLGELLEPWLAELDDRLAHLDRHLEVRREEIALLEHQLGTLSSEAFWRRWAPTRTALLRVREVGDDEVRIALSYRVPGATWTPAYVLDADGLFRRGRFTMRALVVQATGEDWRGVSLSLSTAPSTRRVELPELPALRLGAAQPSTPSPWRPLPADLEELFPTDLPTFRREPPRDRPRPTRKRAPAPEDAPAPSAAPMTSGAMLPAEHDAAPVMAMPPAPRSRSAGGLVRAMAAAVPAREEAAKEVALVGAPPPPLSPQLQPSHLDYPSLRLRRWDAEPGDRGRLRPQQLGDDLVEAGLPPSARARLASCTQEARAGAARVGDKPLPAHHVLPGPVEDAHYRFDAEATVELPSDGRFHNVAVFSEPLELTVRYRTVPRLDPRAFRLVTAALERSAPLLPGPVDVHVDGSLVLTTPWKGMPGRGVLELDLGVEDGIKVARNVRYREESAGMFGGSRRLFTTIEVQVASSLPREARVEILERVPVPAGDDVAVDLPDADPQATEYAGERDGPLLKGGRRQVVQVPPAGQRIATLTYAVTLAAKDELVGGDRRG